MVTIIRKKGMLYLRSAQLKALQRCHDRYYRRYQALRLHLHHWPLFHYHQTLTPRFPRLSFQVESLAYDAPPLILPAWCSCLVPHLH